MENGKIVIKLDKYLKENNISRSSLSKNGRLRYDTILSYCRNEVTRLDTDTLVRLCSTLNCKLNDIVEYVQEK
ncbi:MAG: helix-turn-helix transcriptional regulator [Clostridia bacterium]|nr:helix-turn-helix transcriptional regulator [Clostridia bacterium]MCI9274891.1 helix-turn-helix transcriptional regulator [Clostridia bacterium]